MNDEITQLVDWQLSAMPDPDNDPLDAPIDLTGRCGYTTTDIEDVRNRMLRHVEQRKGASE